MELKLEEEPKYNRGGRPVLTQKQVNEEFANARDDGFEVVTGDNYRLCLDLDTQEDPISELQIKLEFIKKILPKFSLFLSDLWKSKSGNHHAVIEVFYDGGPVSILERLLLEVILGSDTKRAVYNYGRVLEGVADDEVSALFRPKNAESLYDLRTSK